MISFPCSAKSSGTGSPPNSVGRVAELEKLLADKVRRIRDQEKLIQAQREKLQKQERLLKSKKVRQLY